MTTVKIELERKYDKVTNYFSLPDQYNKTGIRIENIVIDNNTVPKSQYTMIGPRALSIKIMIMKTTKVYAEIVQL